MTDLPQIAIVMVTYKRTREAVITAKSTCENLLYPKELRSWYVADDGSSPEHVQSILNEIQIHDESLIGYHSEKFWPGTTHCGHGWNIGLQKGHQYGEIILWLEDDWHLDHKLDISNYVRLLMEREDVGLVRLGGLAVGNDVRIVGHNGVHYLEYLRNQQYCYSGNPLLRHTRFLNSYGLFAEDRNPGDIELDYDGRFRASNGPSIWRPAEINPWGAFGHIGTERTFS